MMETRQILHVDDDPLLTAMVAKRLQAYGYQTTPLHDPQEVIRELPRFQERVMLLDIDMPGVNGMDLLKQVKASDSGILVVMLTGLTTMNTVLRSLHLGAEACFFKPLTDYDPLADALADCFRKIDRWWAVLNDLATRRKAEWEQRAAVVESESCRTGLS